ncbi:hypothetical protein MTDSW087_00158 [Methylobacterium dankookense]|uniref:Uncharacterized protein n=1 Tax=Methylobacterium dankookense TaxID=560405 RepID=A0A564FSV6_9HYPH|nr:hypothetical protein IFDJLNFL_3999 [Methylobacterium dankookense]VUF10491.1 hypothetical protein MTDSW087_00158 [Methylobacterium dankookense]
MTNRLKRISRRAGRLPGPPAMPRLTRSENPRGA